MAPASLPGSLLQGVSTEQNKGRTIRKHIGILRNKSKKCTQCQKMSRVNVKEQHMIFHKQDYFIRAALNSNVMEKDRSYLDGEERIHG